MSKAKKKTPPAPNLAAKTPPLAAAAGKVSRGKPKKERKDRSPGPDGAIEPVLSPAPSAPPTPYTAPPGFTPPEAVAFFWKEALHNELSQAWLALNERQQGFFIEWVGNGFNATKAYMHVYKVENKSASRASACSLLTNPNVMRLRKAIQDVQSPPLELMASAEQAALEADDDIDPKKYKFFLMRLDAVQTIRSYYRGLQPQGVDVKVTGKVDHEHKGKVEHEFDIADLKDLLNGPT